MNNCPNCGASIVPGENNCRACGTVVSSPQVSGVQPQMVNNTNVNYQQPNMGGIPQNNMYVNGMQQNYMNSDDDLITAYIGNNANKLMNGGFSFCTFLFGGLYVLYRKMWLIALIWIIVAFVLGLFLKSLILMAITLVVSIAFAFFFKKMYLDHVKKQVDKIKAENPNATRQQLLAICNQKGGTSALAVIIYFVVAMVVGIILSLNTFKDIIGDINYKSQENVTNKIVYEVKDNSII